MGKIKRDDWNERALAHTVARNCLSLGVSGASPELTKSSGCPRCISTEHAPTNSSSNSFVLIELNPQVIKKSLAITLCCSHAPTNTATVIYLYNTAQ